MITVSIKAVAFSYFTSHYLQLAAGRMDARRHSFSFKIEQMDNGSFVVSVVRTNVFAFSL